MVEKGTKPELGATGKAEHKGISFKDLGPLRKIEFGYSEAPGGTMEFNQQGFWFRAKDGETVDWPQKVVQSLQKRCRYGKFDFRETVMGGKKHLKSFRVGWEYRFQLSDLGASEKDPAKAEAEALIPPAPMTGD